MASLDDNEMTDIFSPLDVEFYYSICFLYHSYLLKGAG